LLNAEIGNKQMSLVVVADAGILYG